MTHLHNHLKTGRVAFLTTMAILSAAYPSNGYKPQCTAASVCFGHSNTQNDKESHQSPTSEKLNIKRLGFTAGSASNQWVTETVQAILKQTFDSTTIPDNDRVRNRDSSDHSYQSDYNNVTKRFNSTVLDSSGPMNFSSVRSKNFLGIENFPKTTAPRKKDDHQIPTVTHDSEDLGMWRWINITEDGNDSSISDDEASTAQITFHSKTVTGEVSYHEAPIVTTLSRESNESNNDPASLDIYWQQRVTEQLYTYVAPFIIGIGIVGNTLSVITLQHSFFRSSTTGFILTVLSLADMTALNVGIMHKFIRSAFNIDVRVLTSFGCKLHFMLTYFIHQLSSWMIVLLTAERTISVCMPLRCKELCSKRRVVIACFAITFLTFCQHIFFFIAFDIKFYLKAPSNAWFSNQAAYDCDVRDNWAYFYNEVWLYLYPSVAEWFPFTIILAGNVVTIVVLAKSYKSRRGQMRVSSNCAADNHMTSTSVMLIGVSAMFIVLNLPREVVYIIYTGPVPRGEETAIFNFLNAIGYIIVYSNNAFGFLVYFASGRRFRRAFMETFCPCRRPTINSFHSRSTMTK